MQIQTLYFPYFNGSNGTGIQQAEFTTISTPSVQPAFDEGGNFIEVRYGPLSPVGDYSVLTLPAAATLNPPTGTLPTFTWNAVTGASDYRLLVRNNATNATLIDTLYSAAEVGCDTGTLCSPVIPTPQLDDGSYKGWVRTKNALGWGPLSDVVRFSVGSVPGKAILDTPTGTLPTFSWNAVTGASDYRLLVRDNATNATLIDTLYSAGKRAVTQVHLFSCNPHPATG